MGLHFSASRNGSTNSTRVRIAASIAIALTLTMTAVARGQAGPISGGPTVPIAGPADTIAVLAGNAPDSLDPQLGFSPPAAEADWLAYTPLLTYQHVAGPGGGVLIPGLATALPTISADGRTYELTLRKGLTYSNGQPVKASDFAYAIERAIAEGWEGKTFYTTHIEGAAAYDAGEAPSISGIATDDSTGKITIRLTQPYGAFANVLAFPSSGLVPSGTPMTDLSANPPPGVGPYTITSVEPDGSYTMKRNAKFASFNIAGIPTGFVGTIRVTIVEDSSIEAVRVLNNQADVFDASDQIPPLLLPLVRQKASDRFSNIPSASTFYFFLNTTRAPFNSLKAREAVNTALDRQKLALLSGGFIKPSCYLIPEGIIGHPTAPCPFGETPNIAKAKQLVAESGMAGTPVTVWGPERGPKREYADYFTEMLNQIGFEASERLVENGSYFEEIGGNGNDPQIGFASWFQDFPNPSDFYVQMDGRAIEPTNNVNLSKVDDPLIQAQLLPLNEVPSTRLESVAGQWQALDSYVASQAYIAAFGEQVSPKFYSNRVDYSRGVFHVLYGNDFSTLRLK